MAVGTLLAALTVGLVLYKLYRWAFGKVGTVPIVQDGFPVFGALKGFNEDPEKFFKRVREKYGEVVCVNLLFRKVVFFLGNNPAKFYSMPDEKMSFHNALESNVGHITGQPLYADKPPKHLSLADTSIIQGFSASKTHQFVPRMVEIIRGAADQWVERCKSSGDGQVELLSFVNDVFQKINFAYLLSMSPQDVDRLQLSQHVLNQEKYSSHPLCVAARWMTFVEPVKTFDAAVTTIRKVVLERIQELDAEYRRNPEALSKAKDYFSNFWYPQLDSELKPMHAMDHIFWLIMAAATNTVGTTTWGIYFLLKHQDYKDKLMSLIQEASGGHVALDEDWDWLDKVDYFEHIMRETTRITSSTMSMRRSQIELRNVLVNSKIQGDTVIPKDTYCFLFPRVWAFDEDIFPDPLSFNPDRFDSFKESSNKARFAMFGVGKHYCQGHFFAKKISRVLWTVLLNEYDINVDASSPAIPELDLSKKLGISLFTKDDIPVRVSIKKK